MTAVKESSPAQQILAAIEAAIGAAPAALHEPEFSGNEWNYVKQCLDSSYVSSVGAFVDRFENELVAFTGAGHAIAVVNGTAALHMALILAGVNSGDEVLLPALTFVATANAVSYCGAHPHFVDSEENSLGVDTCRLRAYLDAISKQVDGRCVNSASGRVIRALLPMHTFGHAGDIDGLMSISRDYNIALVEDSAESLGSYYHGSHTGTFGIMGTLSFNGNKVVTTGGGGAILTNNAALAKRAKHLTTTAKLPHAWEYRHDEIGYNYRMPNINAALGCAQLEQLPQLLDKKRELFRRYQSAFARVDSARLISEPDNCSSNYWLQTIILNQDHADQRDLVLKTTNEAGYMTRPAWTLMHRLEPYRDCQKMELPVAESMERRLINLPSNLPADDQANNLKTK